MTRPDTEQLATGSVVVTGGSGGIGRAIAEAFNSSHSVFLHYYTSRANAEQTASALRKKGGAVYLVQADLSTAEGCERLVRSVEDRATSMDVLVNSCGGVIERHSFREITWDLIRQHFELNTYSAMMLSSMFVPLLEKGTNPSIINVTSAAVRSGSPTITLYGAAKGALDVFTRGMANELAPGIRVNAIAPGIIETDFILQTPRERLENTEQTTPLERLGLPTEVAHAALFLAENTFTTGATIDVNGGLFMR